MVMRNITCTPLAVVGTTPRSEPALMLT